MGPSTRPPGVFCILQRDKLDHLSREVSGPRRMGGRAGITELLCGLRGGGVQCSAALNIATILMEQWSEEPPGQPAQALELSMRVTQTPWIQERGLQPRPTCPTPRVWPLTQEGPDGRAGYCLILQTSICYGMGQEKLSFCVQTPGEKAQP